MTFLYLALTALVAASVEGCNIGFVELGGHCYLFSTTSGQAAVSALEAKLFCLENGAELANLVVEDVSDADPLLKHVFDNKLANNPGLYVGSKKTSGEWRWSDGRSLSDASLIWYVTEPTATDDCGFVLNASDGHFRYYMHGSPCTDKRNFICGKSLHIMDEE